MLEKTIHRIRKQVPYRKLARGLESFEKTIHWSSTGFLYWKSWCAMKAGLWNDDFFYDFHALLAIELDLRSLYLAINYKRIKYGWSLDELEELVGSRNYARYSADPVLNALIASLFHEGGNGEKTVEFLTKSLTQDAQAIRGYLGLSCFAMEQRLILSALPRQDTEKQATLCKKFQSFNAFFNNNLRDKKIAVVGNGPLGKECSKGNFIDTHDHVLRFNNFPSDGRYEKDRGKKITTWVRTPSIHEVPLRDDIQPETVAVASPLLLHTKNGNWRWMLEYCDRDENLVLFDPAVFRDLVQRLNAPPSAGLLAARNISELANDLSEIHFLGFDFNTGNQSHYFDNQKPGNRHNWTSEKIIFSKITDESSNKSSAAVRD